jgi:hypothetical protein
MMNGNSANFDRRLKKLENSKLGVPAYLAGFRIRKIIVREGDDVDQVIKDMEARGEIPPVPADFPAGHINTIVHRIISPPNGEQNWERYHTERYQAAAAGLAKSQSNDRKRQ